MTAPAILPSFADDLPVRMLGQSIGPVIGGIITDYFGFHAIFWFLFILGVSTLLLILFFLPETLRRIAGNGSVPLDGIHCPFFSRSIEHHWLKRTPTDDEEEEEDITSPAPKITVKLIFAPFRFLFEKDVFATLFFGAIVYAVWSMVTSSTTAIFQPRFHLSNLQVGLVFLPNGAGCVAGSYLTGRLLDRNYRIVEKAYRASHGLLDTDTPLDRKKLLDFPVSRARLRSAWYLVIVFILSIAGYGFAVTSPILGSGKSGMAVPLVLQFVIASTATAVFTQNSALMVDLYPGASASATAVNNLVRCSVGAAGVASVQFVVDEVGAGMAFLVFAVVTAGMAPLLGLVWVYGEGWRRERMERLERVEREREERRGVEG